MHRVSGRNLNLQISRLTPSGIQVRNDDLLDNGMIEGHISLADKAFFEAKTHKPQDD